MGSFSIVFVDQMSTFISNVCFCFIELKKRCISQMIVIVYVWCTRGLFEKDKLVFSFMLCVEVLKLSDRVLPEDWNYFMRGAPGTQVDVPPKPDVPWLQLWQWTEACKLDGVLPAFKGIKGDIVTTPCWVKFGDNNVVSCM